MGFSGLPAQQARWAASCSVSILVVSYCCFDATIPPGHRRRRPWTMQREQTDRWYSNVAQCARLQLLLPLRKVNMKRRRIRVVNVERVVAVVGRAATDVKA